MIHWLYHWKKNFCKKIDDMKAEVVKESELHFEVMQDGFVKRSCDADLLFCSWELDDKMKTCEKYGRQLRYSPK